MKNYNPHATSVFIFMLAFRLLMLPSHCSVPRLCWRCTNTFVRRRVCNCSRTTRRGTTARSVEYARGRYSIMRVLSELTWNFQIVSVSTVDLRWFEEANNDKVINKSGFIVGQWNVCWAVTRVWCRRHWSILVNRCHWLSCCWGSYDGRTSS